MKSKWRKTKYGHSKPNYGSGKPSEQIYVKKGKSGWIVEVIEGYAKHLFSKTFKTKAQATKYSKDYMKK